MSQPAGFHLAAADLTTTDFAHPDQGASGFARFVRSAASVVLTLSHSIGDAVERDDVLDVVELYHSRVAAFEHSAPEVRDGLTTARDHLVRLFLYISAATSPESHDHAYAASEALALFKREAEAFSSWAEGIQRPWYRAEFLSDLSDAGAENPVRALVLHQGVDNVLDAMRG